MFLNYLLNFRIKLGLNCEYGVYRGYLGCMIFLRGIWEVDKFKLVLVCLKIGFNDFCSMNV